MITGGTGSFGKAFVRYALEHLKPNVIRVFSRDELKQAQMQEEFKNHPSLRFFIGDIRDHARVQRAFRGVNVVIHAAAMKRIEACEYNPFEAIQTNIIGTKNVIDQAIDCGIEKLISLSTDKACSPVNLYGATKLCQEKIVVQSNSYVGPKKTRLSCVRYGNVVGSRGSVVEIFKAQGPSGTLNITDERMTRFWITLDQAVRFVHSSIEMMQGGEIFIPKIPSMKITDLAKAMFPEAKTKIIGIRPAEKLHEAMITEDESRNVLDLADRFVIKPEFTWWSSQAYPSAQTVPEGFRYSSNVNDRWLSTEELNELTRN